MKEDAIRKSAGRLAHDGGNFSGMYLRPISLMVIIIVSIFGSSTIVNLFLSIFSPLSIDIKFSLLASGLMAVILFPLIYYLVHEPLTSYIKDLNRSEAALQESEAKFRALVETTDDSIYLVNRNCEYLFMNAKHRFRQGFVFDEQYAGRTFGDLHSPEESKLFSEDVRKVFQTGESLQREHRSQRDGKYFLRTFSPIKGPDKEVVAVSIVSKDITRLKQESEVELRYHAIFEQSPNGILIIDAEGNILEFNETARRELGYSREEFAALRLFDINPMGAEQIRQRIKEVVSKGSGEFEVKHKTKGGDLRDVHVFARVLNLFGQKVIQAIWQDITERKQSEEALSKHREHLEKALIERSRTDGRG